MKTSALLPFLATGLLAGAIGYVWGRQDKESAAAARHAGPVVVKAAPEGKNSRMTPLQSPAEEWLSPGLIQLLGGGRFSDSTIRQITFNALEDADPARRAAAIALIVDAMTPANALAIRAAFSDSTAKTGRRHHEEWHLMVRQFGAVLGKAAFDEIKDNEGEARLAMEGWAASDLEAALRNFQSMAPSDPGYSGMRTALLTGIVLKDPAMGFQLALAGPGTSFDAEMLMNSAIQGGGLDGTTAALQQALDGAGAEVAENPAFLKMFNSLTGALFQKNWTAGQSEKILPWIEQQMDQPFVTDDLISHGAKDVILQGKFTEALDLLDRMNAQKRILPGDTMACRPSPCPNLPCWPQADGAVVDRVISLFPHQSQVLTHLTNALGPLNPEPARRLRTAAASRVE